MGEAIGVTERAFDNNHILTSRVSFGVVLELSQTLQELCIGPTPYSTLFREAKVVEILTGFLYLSVCPGGVFGNCFDTAPWTQVASENNRPFSYVVQDRQMLYPSGSIKGRD